MTTDSYGNKHISWRKVDQLFANRSRRACVNRWTILLNNAGKVGSSGNANLFIGGGRQYFDAETQMIKGVFTADENKFIANFILNTPLTNSGKKTQYMWNNLGKII